LKKSVVFTFGRFNPPGLQHAKLFEKASFLAEAEDGDLKIFVSQTHDDLKNPLPYPYKVKLLRKMFPEYSKSIIQDPAVHTPFDALKRLHTLGYEKVVFVVGQDRVNDFKNSMYKYVNTDDPKSLKFEEFKVVSAGNRDPDSDTISGMSSTKLRKYARENEFDAFKAGIPDTLTEPESKEVFDMLRKNLNNIKESVQDADVEDGQTRAYKRFKQWKTDIDEASHDNQPDSDFLVVDKKSGERHLPVKTNGKVDHRLMGAALAALTVGYRGNKYSGPNKSEALAKLKSLYAKEKLELPK